MYCLNWKSSHSKFCVRIMKNVRNALGWLLLNKATQICMLSSTITTLKSRQKNYVGGIS